MSNKKITVLYKVMVSALILCGTPEIKAQASACNASEALHQITIPAGAWPNGSVGPYAMTVGTGINAVTATFTITNVSPFSGGTPTQGTLGGLPNVVSATHNGIPANTSLSTQTVTFSRPINKFSYVATDVDYLVGNWQDVVVTRANGGTVMPTSMTGGANHTINIATGTVTATTSTNCATTSAACNVVANFNLSGINSATHEFRTGPLHGGTTQYVGWTSFGFCAPKRANVTLSKTWANAAVNNAVTVAATGLTSLASIANTANETDTGAAQPVIVGSVLNLSETFTAGSAADYAATLACTGTTGLVGNTLTVGNADTAIVCTHTNTRRTASVMISKTDNKAVTNSGGTNNYVISLNNQGPSNANGVVLTDVVGAGLTCPAANAVTCAVTAGAAVCPVGPLTIASLTGSGITVANFPASSTLQFAYTCNVN